MRADPEVVAFRFGYGLPLPEGAPLDPEAMLAALAGPDAAALRWPVAGMEGALPLMQAERETRRQARRDSGAKAAHRAARAALEAAQAAALRATLARALDSADGFRERLVAFWADHFTAVARSGQDALLPYALVEEAIRPNLGKPFAAMLTAAEFHPAMLVYLDQARSVGPNSRGGLTQGSGLNENLAREVIELHTLGAGAGYGQDDVRQMAELLTGLSYNLKRGMYFDRNRAEPGAEAVLGRSYDGEGLAPIRAVLADLSRHPDTARHLARKLAVHFVADTPEPDLVAAIEAAWRQSGGDLAQVHGALLRHPAAWGPAAAKARQPFEFVVAGLRALGLAGSDVAAMAPKVLSRHIVAALAAMGQPVKAPRGPDGWPEAPEAWITPQGLAARITWAMQAPVRLAGALPDPVALAQRALDGRADAALLRAAAQAEDRREGVGLVLASPAFNRR